MMRKTLRTADVALATYLKMEGFEIDRLEIISNGSPKPVAEFVFTDPIQYAGSVSRLTAAQMDYERGNARCEPRAFALEFRRVRDQLFSFLQTYRHTR